MSALPTAEDVLAAALLDELWNVESDTPPLAEMVPDDVCAAYMSRWCDLGNDHVLVDCERRYEVEAASAEVLRLARGMGGFLTDRAFVRAMATAANRLIDAEDEVARHA